jgi:hypothetical protein
MMRHEDEVLAQAHAAAPAPRLPTHAVPLG